MKRATVKCIRNHRARSEATIDFDDWKYAPYGKFTRHIREKYDPCYGEEEKETRTVEVTVYGRKVCRFTGKCFVTIAKGEDIDDAMNRVYESDVDWDSWPDEDDEIEITDWDAPEVNFDVPEKVENDKTGNLL